MERRRAVRLGIASELASFLAPSLVDFAHRRGDITFEVACDPSETLIDRVRDRQLDVALAMTSADDAEGSVARWPMPLAWVAAPRLVFDKSAPVRLVTPPEGTLFYNIAFDALRRAGRKFEVVCKSANPDMLRSAVDAGYGVSLAPRALAPKGARELPQALLTPLPEVTLGLFAHEDSGEREPLLSHMIDLLEASPELCAA